MLKLSRAGTLAAVRYCTRWDLAPWSQLRAQANLLNRSPSPATRAGIETMAPATKMAVAARRRETEGNVMRPNRPLTTSRNTTARYVRPTLGSFHVAFKGMIDDLG